jgi:hypothetical protein
MNRYDSLVTAFMAFLAILLFTKEKKLINLLFYFLGFIIPVIPWMLYSINSFGLVWVSDNSGTAWLIRAVVPQRYYSEGFSPKTLFSSPGLWVRNFFQVKLRSILMLFCPCSCMGALE